MGFIAGQYYARIAGTYIGQTDGINIDYTLNGEPIVGDNLGDSWQDGIYQGGECFVNLELLKFNSAKALTSIWPMSGELGQAGTVGVLLTSLAGVLTLEAAPSTPAHDSGTTSGSPRIITANKAILAPGFPVEFPLGPTLRRVPLRFQLFPFTDTVDYWFKCATTGTTAAPSAVGNFLAGKYDVTYRGTSIGQTDGIRLGWRMHSAPIRGDNLPGGAQDGVYRGADVWISMVLMEYNNAKALEALWPFIDTAVQTDVGKVGVIGLLHSGKSEILELTALAGTPAAADTDRTVLTIDKAILAPGSPVSLSLRPELRAIPLRFNCVPQGSPTEWFVFS